MPKIDQINNLKISFSTKRNKWMVKSPKGVLLKEFRKLDRAREYAKRNKDYREKRRQ